MKKNYLLVITVGGSTEPVVFSILHWRPARTLFIVSKETRQIVNSSIIPEVQSGGWSDFDSGRTDLHEIPDAQNLNDIVNQLRTLDNQIIAWLRDHQDAEVVADITGGTKAMSAALAIASRNWPCQICYVAGTERTKDGVGIVVSGKERIMCSQNPVDALGLLALDSALNLLQNHAFAAAKALLCSTISRVADVARKREIAAVSNLADALADWDRFQHGSALNKLKNLHRDTHNLEAALGRLKAQEILAKITKLESHLQSLCSENENSANLKPTRELVLDLIANARRRMDEQRWDDATARLYRAIEAEAQLWLAKNGINDTSKVPLDKIPESIRKYFESYAVEGHVKLGLQEAWIVIKHMDEKAAAPFFDANLADMNKSPLTARNQSILAHGFAPASKANTQRLFDAALAILDATEAELPVSPFDRQNTTAVPKQ